MTGREMRTCRNCHTNVIVQVRKPNHALHLCLTLMTAGLWGFVWMAAMLEASVARPKPCPVCGSRSGVV
jgi:hypothetical protein